jgi:hypothetical protein
MRILLSLLAPLRAALLNKALDAAVRLIAKVKWRQRHPISAEKKAELHELLRRDYYVIATRRSNFLSTFFISLAHFCLTGRWGFYTHVLLNLEDEVTTDADFRLIEAATTGVHYTTLAAMCENCDAIALLRPRNLTLADWTAALDAAKTQLGKPYDTLFDLKSDQQVSCVELVRNALMHVPGYWEKFSHFEHEIARRHNLTPQMFLESPDFEVAWEAKRGG